MARCRYGLSPNRPPGTVRSQNLWRKCSARALETHGDIVCELGFTEERRSSQPLGDISGGAECVHLV